MDQDKILYRKFLKGDNTAFDEIMDIYAEHLIYFIQRYVERLDIAEDIAQDVFVYVLMNRNKYNFKYSLKTYLYLIAKSRAINYIKGKKKIVSITEHEIYDEDSDIEDVVFKNEKAYNLRQAINKLSKEQQTAILLVDIEGMQYKDAERILGKSNSQLKMILCRGRKKLKEILSMEVQKYYG